MFGDFARTIRKSRTQIGIKSENFYWFLKECGWHFNSGVHRLLRKQLEHWYISTKHKSIARTDSRHDIV